MNFVFLPIFCKLPKSFLLDSGQAADEISFAGCDLGRFRLVLLVLKITC